MGAHWKIWFLGESWKTNIQGDCLKRGLEQFDLRGDWAKKRGWYFWGELNPNAHYDMPSPLMKAQSPTPTSNKLGEGEGLCASDIISLQWFGTNSF